MDEIEYECEMTFQNVEYLVSLNTVQVSSFDMSSNKLIIDLEEKVTGDLWRGDYQVKFVEEITKKTGVFKKFPVFVKMLLSAFR